MSKLSLFKTTLATYLGISVFQSHICSIQPTSGPSMEPTLRSKGDWVLADQLTFRYFRKPKIDDLIAFRTPYDPERMAVKRVMGIQGDRIHCWVTGEQSGELESRVVVVPAGHLWVEGDNYENSNDSRHYGPIPIGLVQGRVFMRIWDSVAWL